MRQFDHIGLKTTEKQPGEMYVEETKVWVTNPADNPSKVEYLRYADDSPVADVVRETPHVAFRVDSLDREIEGEKVVLGPFQATEDLRVAFIHKDGLVYEFMEISQDKDWHKPTQD